MKLFLQWRVRADLDSGRALADSCNCHGRIRSLNTLDESLGVHPSDHLINLVTRVLILIGLQILHYICSPSGAVTIQLMHNLQA